MSVNEETLRLARKLRITVNAEVDQTVRELVRAWADAWGELHDEWSDAMMDLATASTEGTWPGIGVIARADRAQTALLHANEEIASLSEFAGVRVTDAVGRVVTATPEWQAQILASQLPAEAGARADLAARFNRFDPYELGWIVERTTEQIQAATYRLELAAQDALRRTLIRGVAVGDNPRKAARAMVRRVEGAFNGGLTRALVLARTEILDAHRSAAAVADFANQDLVTGWMWHAQLDTRTCPSCWAMHGTRHNIEEQGPQDHQQGRCARLPLAKTWRELGFDIDEPASVVPDAEQVFAALPEASQLQIMGPDRLKALRDGTATFADLSTRRSTPGWRDSWAPTPVKDLRRAS